MNSARHNWMILNNDMQIPTHNQGKARTTWTDEAGQMGSRCTPERPARLQKHIKDSEMFVFWLKTWVVFNPVAQSTAQWLFLGALFMLLHKAQRQMLPVWESRSGCDFRGSVTLHAFSSTGQSGAAASPHLLKSSTRGGKKNNNYTNVERKWSGLLTVILKCMQTACFWNPSSLTHPSSLSQISLLSFILRLAA